MTTNQGRTPAEGGHEFCSPAWVGCVRDLIGASLEDIDLTGVTMSFSEELTDPRAHLLTADRPTVGWHYPIDDGTLTVEDEPKSDADLRMIGDYDTVVVLARLPYADPTIGPLAEAALAQGMLRYEGILQGWRPPGPQGHQPAPRQPGSPHLVMMLRGAAGRRANRPWLFQGDAEWCHALLAGREAGVPEHNGRYRWNRRAAWTRRSSTRLR